MLTFDEIICLVLLGAFMLLTLNVVTRLRMHRDGLRLSGMLSRHPKKCCLQAQRLIKETSKWAT